MASVVALDPVAEAGEALDLLEPELLCVRAGLKPAGRHSLRIAEAPPLIAALQRLGLAATLFEPPDPGAGIAYLAPAEQARLLAEPRGHLLYARDPADLAALLAAHREADNDAIGALLGYPPCCIAANRLWAMLGFNDYVRVARLSDAFDWRLNIFIDGLPGERLQLLSHFPCSLACPASIELAERRLAVLRARRPPLAAAIAAAARLPLFLHDDSGLPAERRTGLAGWLLRGIRVGEDLVYDGRRPLRPAASLKPALPERGRVSPSAGGWRIDAAAGTAPPLQLERDRWLLLLPS
jgi:hypothetical protein